MQLQLNDFKIRTFYTFSAISLFEARIRAFSPNNVSVASTTDVCRLEILANAHFLSNIKIAKLIEASNEKEYNFNSFLKLSKLI